MIRDLIPMGSLKARSKTLHPKPQGDTLHNEDHSTCQAATAPSQQEKS